MNAKRWLAMALVLLPLWLGAEALPGQGSAKSYQSLSEPQKQRLVSDFTHQALAAYKAGRYQQAIDLAQKMRDVPLSNDKKYLENARKIILAASKKQKDLFEPTLNKALQKYTLGDYQTSLALCQGLLKRDPTYDEARRCVDKAHKRIQREVASPGGTAPRR